MPDDWKRVGIEVRSRRARLGYITMKEFAARVGVSVETVGNIENARKDSYSPGTRSAVEEALGWTPGSFMGIAKGGKPKLVEDRYLERIRAAWPKLSEQTRRLLAEVVEATLRAD